MNRIACFSCSVPRNLRVQIVLKSTGIGLIIDGDGDGEEEDDDDDDDDDDDGGGGGGGGGDGDGELSMASVLRIRMCDPWWRAAEPRV
ncbi:hypothetical protein PanWU01x14_044020 [Parasponia andersonii]|uniref:Uncharacterized protein n=1 Tax=Parasponia andersonii TaxID=3476 RepID=A0A2P5DP39_PARAD|nr:hypothetical protein PanWU01x14_044020 [Parasponia andersonii]